MKGRATRVLVGIALAVVTALPGAAAAQDELDPSGFYIAADCKSGLTDEDRKIVQEYLADRAGQFRAAPRELVATLKTTRVWLPDVYDEFATEVPSRIARQISAPKEGTRRIVFD